MPLAFIQNLGAWEIFLIFLIVLMLFGAKRLPELFRSFGKSITEFKKATQGIEDDIRDAVNSDPEQRSKNDSGGERAASSERREDAQAAEANGASETPASDNGPETPNAARVETEPERKDATRSNGPNA